ncbi:MAG: flavodoxin family protein [Bacillota bacterium]
MIEKAVVIYWSKTGNTEKVAYAIKEGLEEKKIEVELKTTTEAEEIDFFDYDLIALGCPSYQWSPPEEVDQFLKDKFTYYQNRGEVKLKAPKKPDRNVLLFCTYSGPHTGKKEAVPVLKYTGQFFEHLGFNILDEIYVLGEHHGSEEASTEGKMGDIRGLPDKEDLIQVKNRVKELI